MSESGETGNQQSPFEFYKMLEERGDRMTAALGYLGLAMYANNTTLATNYYDRAIGALSATEEDNASREIIDGYQLIDARGILNLSPITRKLFVGRELSEPDDVREVSRTFVHDLSRQARQVKKYLNRPERSIRHKLGFVLPALNMMAVQGLLMYAQTEMLKTDDWMSCPAFYTIDLFDRDQGIIRNFWHVGVFSGGSSTDFDLKYRLLVRNSRNSAHKNVDNPDYSLIWMDEHTGMPGDTPNAVCLDVIEDLQNKRPRIERRAEKLLEAIDENTLGSIQASC